MLQSSVPSLITERGLDVVLDIAVSGLNSVVEDAVECLRLFTNRQIAQLGREADVPTLLPRNDVGRIAIERVLEIAMASPIWGLGHSQWGVALCALWIRLVCSLATDADIGVNMRRVSAAECARRLIRLVRAVRPCRIALPYRVHPGWTTLRCSVVGSGAHVLELAVVPLSTLRAEVAAMAPQFRTSMVWVGIDHADLRCRVKDRLGDDLAFNARLAAGLPATSRSGHPTHQPVDSRVSGLATNCRPRPTVGTAAMSRPRALCIHLSGCMIDSRHISRDTERETKYG